MAPEQALGHAVDQRVDIYAFGLICYDMLLGPRESLHGGLAPLDALMAHRSREIPDARLLLHVHSELCQGHRYLHLAKYPTAARSPP